MDREGLLGLVWVLTEQVVAGACPGKLADFADDFSDFTLQAGALQAGERLAYQRPSGSGLDTTLVAGMFFEVLRERRRLPAGRGAGLLCADKGQGLPGRVAGWTDHPVPVLPPPEPHRRAGGTLF